MPFRSAKEGFLLPRRYFSDSFLIHHNLVIEIGSVTNPHRGKMQLELSYRGATDAATK
jgi:hypothetical protein